MRGDRACLGAPRGGPQRRAPERVRHRHQSRAPAQAAGRSALAVCPGRVPGHRLEVRARLSRPASVEPEQFRDQPAAPDRTGQRGDPQSPVGEPLRHQRGDLGLRAADRLPSAGAARDPHVRRVLPAARRGAQRAGRYPAARRSRADHGPDVPALHLLYDHRSAVDGRLEARTDRGGWARRLADVSRRSRRRDATCGHDQPRLLDHPHRRRRDDRAGPKRAAHHISRADHQARPEGHAQTRRMRRQGSMPNVLLRNNVLRAIGASALLALSVTGVAWGQVVQVSGTVTSGTTHEKLWGVTVRVKGTGTQTITDQQGRYALVAPPNAVLAYSIIGYRGAERPVGGQGTIDVAMEQAPTMLQEVVVTGYQTQRRSDITGAVSSVNLQSANRQTSTSVLQRLDGRIPGVTMNNSGSPGSRSTVRIRGVSSFHDNDPLYIIDGTPVDDSYLNFLNPKDIGAIQVLKDASSASIYGSRASNGVVIIETRKGRSGGRLVSLDVRTGVASPVRGYDDFVMSDPLQYFQVIKRAYHNAGQAIPPEVTAIYGDTLNPSVPRYTYITPGVTVVTRDAFGRPDSINRSMYAYPNTLIMPGSAGTDWWKAVFGPAQYTDANLALSGGGTDNAYNVSFSYLKQDGTAAYNQLQRGTVRINTAFTVNKMTLGENIAVSRDQGYGGLDDNALGEGNIVGKNILMQPVVPIYDIGGNFASGKATGLGNNTNPLKYAWARRFDRNTNDRAIGNVFGRFEVVPALALRSQFSFNLTQGQFTGFTPTTFENSEANAVNSIVENDNRSTTWTFTNTLTYARTMERHTLSVLLGQEANSSSGRFITGGISGLYNDDPANRYIQDGLGSASSKTVNTTGFFDRLLSFFGKADYNYGEKYYASVTLRRGGSFQIRHRKRVGAVPAVTAGWRGAGATFFRAGRMLSDATV